MLFRSFDFIALNYNQHHLKQQKGFCSVSPLLCASCFHPVSFSSPLLTPHTGCNLQLLLVNFKHLSVCLCSNFLARILEMVVNVITSACIACCLLNSSVHSMLFIFLVIVMRYCLFNNGYIGGVMSLSW